MKILIADPHPEVQSALSLLVTRVPESNTVNLAGSLLQLFSQCAQTYPDLILFDLELIPSSRAQTLTLPELMTVLQCICPGSKVVVMSSRFEAKQEALAAGASGFISKTDPPDVVTSGIVQFLNNRS